MMSVAGPHQIDTQGTQATIGAELCPARTIPGQDSRAAGTFKHGDEGRDADRGELAR